VTAAADASAPERTVRVNGEPRRVAATTIAELLVELGRGHDPPPGLAVAQNLTVVPRRDWSTRQLADGDDVEILGAVQGG
jgi:thiamine biosynthesis protein ThiS